jgi:hypothetical protein
MTETIPYEVTGTAGEAELRHYSQVVLATVQSEGDDSGFRHLYAFITGSNRARNTIPMTAPVITSEKIPMTTPVITSSSILMTSPVISAKGTMSFVMPADMPPDRVPEPTDDRVRIEKVPARDVAAIRFSGHAHEHDVEEVTTHLLAELGKAGIPTRGSPFLMRYNSPMTPGFLRRNEVGVEIER